MSELDTKTVPTGATLGGVAVPVPILGVFRGVGQVFFQENALSGLLFVVGVALSSPTMAAGLLAGAAIGYGVALALKFDAAEIRAGIYGFNAALVGIATLFFFRPGAASLTLLVLGSAVAAPVTRLARRYVPFPTYTAPFIVITWIVFLIGRAAGLPTVDHGAVPDTGFLVAVTNGIGQVMFQGDVWTGRLFLIGLAVGCWEHALWVLAGSVLGTMLGSYHASDSARAIDPEALVERLLAENVALGLYGYNATLAAVALFLWRRSLIPPLVGIVLSVPITEYFPRLGLPALTAPFVLATWAVLALGWLDEKFLHRRPTSPP